MQIDVSQILLDPDFVDPVTLIHRKPIVNEFGQNFLREQSVPAFACIQPISGEALDRLPDALRASNVKTFWIQAGIISDGSCEYPDVILYRGVRYAVQSVLDWSQWGSGWSEGICIVEKPIL